MTPETPLTDAHLDQYKEDGFCLVRQLISVDLIAAIRDQILALAEAKPDWPDRNFHYLDPARYAYPSGSPRPISFQHPAEHHGDFAAVADHPSLVAAMTTLLAGPVQRFTDQVGIKFGFVDEEQGSMSFFHQDSAYWKIAPELGSNCWLPVADVDRVGSALAVMPGSQRGWDLMEHEDYDDDPPIGSVIDGQFTSSPRKRIPIDQVEFSKEMLLPMSPGDALFFTNYTWHRSEPNRTGHTQAFYAIAYERCDA